MKSEAGVLIVGKDEMLLQTRKLILGGYFHVETAGRVSHAISLATEHRFDLIVLCYSLTDEEGGKVIGVARQQKPRPLILTMSALGRAVVSSEESSALMSEDGPLALVKKCAEMLGVELKRPGRRHAAGARRRPARTALTP